MRLAALASFAVALAALPVLHAQVDPATQQCQDQLL